MTGVSGFLGRAVALELMERGFEVTGVSRTEPALVDGRLRHVALDLCARASTHRVFAVFRPDVTVHLATTFTSGIPYEEAIRLDCRMWRNLSGVAHQTGRMLIASTELSIQLDDQLTPFQRAYVKSKASLERDALSFYQLTNTPTWACRFPHLAGATEQVGDRHTGRILNKLLLSAVGVSRDPVPIYVAHNARLRYLHVQDAAETLADRAESFTGFGIEECGSEAIEISFGELVHLVERVVGSPPRVEWLHGSPDGEQISGWRLGKAERIVRDTFAWVQLHTAVEVDIDHEGQG